MNRAGRRPSWLLCCVLTLAGCASLDATPPAGFDLTGTWVMDPLYSDPLSAGRNGAAGSGDGDAGARPQGGGGPGRGQPPRSGGRSAAGGRGAGGGGAMAFDFPILSAGEFTIEQNADSMGLSIPGEPLRDVSWGEVERGLFTIEAGWEDQRTLIVHSRADQVELTERYQLSADGRHLTLVLELEDRRSRTLKRYFDRQP